MVRFSDVNTYGGILLSSLKLNKVLFWTFVKV